MINKYMSMLKNRMQPVAQQQPAQQDYQMPIGYMLAQAPQLPQTEGTNYNPIYAQLIRQMQLRQQPQMMPQGNYMFGQNLLPQPQQPPRQFDYTRAIMGRF